MKVVVKVGQIEIRYLFDGAKKGVVGVFEVKVPPGANVPPPHSHTKNAECVYVLEGVLRYSVDKQSRDLKPDEWMTLPRGSVHHFSNPSSETARALIMLVPDIGEQYFREVGALANADGLSNRLKLMEVMSRYGLVGVGLVGVVDNRDIAYRGDPASGNWMDAEYLKLVH